MQHKHKVAQWTFLEFLPRLPRENAYRVYIIYIYLTCGIRVEVNCMCCFCVFFNDVVVVIVYFAKIIVKSIWKTVCNNKEYFLDIIDNNKN